MSTKKNKVVVELKVSEMGFVKRKVAALKGQRTKRLKKITALEHLVWLQENDLEVLRGRKVELTNANQGLKQVVEDKNEIIIQKLEQLKEMEDIKAKDDAIKFNFHQDILTLKSTIKTIFDMIKKGEL